MEIAGYTVKFLRNEIKVGCCYISHEEVTEVYRRIAAQVLADTRVKDELERLFTGPPPRRLLNPPLSLDLLRTKPISNEPKP